MSTPLTGFGATAASLALFTAVSATSQADVVVEDNTITLTQAGVTIIPLETVRLPDTPRDDGQPWPLPSPVGPLLVKATGDLIHPTRFLIEKSDVVMPAQNHQAALFSFRTKGDRPVALIASFGGTNVINGRTATHADIHIDPDNQNYMILGGNNGLPANTRLDGIRQEEDKVRQIVFTNQASEGIESQIRGDGVVVSGAQFVAVPMNENFYQNVYLPAQEPDDEDSKSVTRSMLPHQKRGMNVGAGAAVEGKFYADNVTQGYNPAMVWDYSSAEQLRIQFVHASNWTHLTGDSKPPTPITEAQYAARGIPFFHVADEAVPSALGDGGSLNDVAPVRQPALEKAPVIRVNPYPRPQAPSFSPW